MSVAGNVRSAGPQSTRTREARLFPQDQRYFDCITPKIPLPFVSPSPGNASERE